MNFFDFNCMLGPTNTNREPAFQTVAELISEMDRLGIDEAMVYSSLSRHAHPADGNAWLMDAIRDEPRLHPCWVGLPPGTGEQAEPTRFVAQMQQQGVRALRLLPKAHNYPLVERSLRPLLAALAAAKIPLLIDTDRGGWSVVSPYWNEVFEIAEKHPDLPIVLIREGGSTARVLYSVWDQFPNIRLDASYLQESRAVGEVISRFGADKLIFGSAMPHYDAGGPLASVAGALIDKASRAAIAGGNARRLLGLPEKSDTAAPVWPCGPNKLRVFDVHGHLGRWDMKYYSDWSAKHMVDYMDQLGIERFLVSDVLAIGPDYRSGNDRMGRAVTEFPDRIMGYAVYNPNYEDQMAGEMRRCFDELGASGIKLHCMLHYTDTADKSYRLAFQTAHERNCPMLCHTEGNPSVNFFKGILADFPDCNFIYAHLGGCSIPMMATMIEVAQSCPNFYYDLGVSNMPRGALKWLTENCPLDQILYGSDHPLNDFTFQLGRVLYADIDDNAKRKILWDNAARIFKV